MVRMQDPADEKIGIEIMHILLDTQYTTSNKYDRCIPIETGITNNEADEAHRVVNEKVRNRLS